MTETQFIQASLQILHPGETFANPKRGVTEIVRIDAERLVYRRGSSKIATHLRDFHRAFTHFRGRRVSSVNLPTFAPSVFDSNPAEGPAGHSCNCTVLFHLLGALGLAGPVEGAGVAGDPYTVVVLGR